MVANVIFASLYGMSVLSLSVYLGVQAAKVFK